MRLAEFCSATLRKRYKRYWPENAHIVWETYEGLEINANSITEANQFLL